jgi:hypothetical protein
MKYETYSFLFSDEGIFESGLQWGEFQVDIPVLETTPKFYETTNPVDNAVRKITYTTRALRKCFVNLPGGETTVLTAQALTPHILDGFAWFRVSEWLDGDGYKFLSNRAYELIKEVVC